MFFSGPRRPQRGCEPQAENHWFKCWWDTKSHDHFETCSLYISEHLETSLPNFWICRYLCPFQSWRFCSILLPASFSWSSAVILLLLSLTAYKISSISSASYVRPSVTVPSDLRQPYLEFLSFIHHHFSQRVLTDVPNTICRFILHFHFLSIFPSFLFFPLLHSFFLDRYSHSPGWPWTPELSASTS